MYLSFLEYLDFGGALNEVLFLRLESKARALINSVTFGRLVGAANMPPTLPILMFELINKLYELEGSFTQASNDGVSITVDWFGINSQIDLLPEIYLSNYTTEDGTPLLYMGVQ